MTAGHLELGLPGCEREVKGWFVLDVPGRGQNQILGSSWSVERIGLLRGQLEVVGVDESVSSHPCTPTWFLALCLYVTLQLLLPHYPSKIT